MVDAAGVDIHTIVAYIWLAGFGWRVPLYDELAVIEIRLKKRLTDPKQIIPSLAAEGRAWANAGMDEEAQLVIEVCR